MSLGMSARYGMGANMALMRSAERRGRVTGLTESRASPSADACWGKSLASSTTANSRGAGHDWSWHVDRKAFYDASAASRIAHRCRRGPAECDFGRIKSPAQFSRSLMRSVCCRCIGAVAADLDVGDFWSFARLLSCRWPNRSLPSSATNVDGWLWTVPVIDAGASCSACDAPGISDGVA